MCNNAPFGRRGYNRINNKDQEVMIMVKVAVTYEPDGSVGQHFGRTEFFKVYDANNNCIEIPMFAGFLSSNKQDKIGITVNDLLDNHLLIHYTIFKKKINRNIHMYYRILKLN